MLLVLSMCKTVMIDPPVDFPRMVIIFIDQQYIFKVAQNSFQHLYLDGSL